MKNYDRITKYLSDLLSKDEKLQFEEELKINSELRRDFENIQSQVKLLAETNFGTDETYFNNLTVNFRKKMAKRKTAKQFRLASAFTFVTAIFLFYFIPKFSNESFSEKILFDNSEIEILSSLNESEKSNILENSNNFSINFKNEDLMNDYIGELDENSVLQLVNNYKLEDYFLKETKDISDKDFDELVSQLNNIKL